MKNPFKRKEINTSLKPNSVTAVVISDGGNSHKVTLPPGTDSTTVEYLSNGVGYFDPKTGEAKFIPTGKSNPEVVAAAAISGVVELPAPVKPETSTSSNSGETRWTPPAGGLR